MSDPRVYNFYHPRIQIPTSTIQTSPGEYRFYCLPVDGAEMLLRIARYLDRKITYVGEVLNDKQYIGPTEQEYQTARNIMYELEEGLMSGCDLDVINTMIERLAIATENLSACTCAMRDAQAAQNAQMPDLSGYVTQEDINYFYPQENYANTDPLATDEEKCEAAQIVWHYIYQQYTETILPWAGESADALIAAIVATAGFSSLFSFTGIPIAIATSLVSSAIGWQIDGSIQNFVNWMLATKEDIICLYYRFFDNYALAAQNVRAFIDAQQDISFLDKVLAKQYFGQEWWYTWIIKGQQADGRWEPYITPGYCSVCTDYDPQLLEFTPCDLSKWDRPESDDMVCNGSWPQIRQNYGRYN
jgi:hypothetical protein